jgi:Ion channel
MPVSRRQSRKGGFTMTIGQGNLLGTLRDRYSDPLLTVLTVLLVFEMFVVAPLQASGIEIFQALGVFAALAMLSGVLILSGSPIALLALFAAISMNVLVIVLRLRGTPTAFDLPLVAAAWLILSITLGAVVGRAVFAPGAINYHRIVGAVLLYLLIALAFVALFVFVGVLVPKAFSGLVLEDNASFTSSAIYFSFVTLTTVGYGDIVPVHPIARSLCNLEAICGQLYPATLLARIVTLEVGSRG